MENDAPLFVIENLDNLELEIKVSEYTIGKVAVGQEAEISADILNGETVHGEVISISPTGRRKRRRFQRARHPHKDPRHRSGHKTDRWNHRPARPLSWKNPRTP